MSDFETRARAAADALGSEHGFGDPAAVHTRLRRRRAVRAVASGAVVLVGIGVIAAARGDDGLRIGTTRSPAATGSVTNTTPTTAPPSPTTSTTVPLPDATQAPNVIVGADAGFVTVRGDNNQVEQHITVADHAYRMRDGSLIGEVHDPEAPAEVTSIWRFPPGGRGTRIRQLAGYRLLGAGIVGGDDVVFLAPPSPKAALVTTAAVVVYDVRTASMRSIGHTSGEGASIRVTVAGGVLLVFGNDGQSTTTVDYYDASTGTRITGRPAPTTRTGPLSPEYVTISPDGNRIAYIDAPTSRDSATEASAPSSDLVIIDARTGAELLRMPLTPSVDAYNWLEFDGRWAIASRFAYSSAGPAGVLPAVVVDTTAQHPAPSQIPGALGITTFDAAT